MVLVVSLTTRKVICRLEGHDSRVQCAAFSADDKRLLTGSADTTALLWSIV